MAVRVNHIFPECFVDTNILKTLLLEGLKDVTKSNESDKDPRIKKLVNALRNSSEMARLERTISYLHDRQYEATVEELVAVFG